jgi:hypothetical protein
VNHSDQAGDEEILASWYDYAAAEPGFVGHWLSLLRVRLGLTPDAQQAEFGADEAAFRRLQAMPLPREQSLAGDAHKIAERCDLKNPMAFVQAMILARNLELAAERPAATQEFYQAAFDEEELE